MAGGAAAPVGGPATSTEFPRRFYVNFYGVSINRHSYRLDMPEAGAGWHHSDEIVAGASRADLTLSAGQFHGAEPTVFSPLCLGWIC